MTNLYTHTTHTFIYDQEVESFPWLQVQNYGKHRTQRDFSFWLGRPSFPCLSPLPKMAHCFTLPFFVAVPKPPFFEVELDCCLVPIVLSRKPEIAADPDYTDPWLHSISTTPIPAIFVPSFSTFFHDTLLPPGHCSHVHLVQFPFGFPVESDLILHLHFQEGSSCWLYMLSNSVSGMCVVSRRAMPAKFHFCLTHPRFPGTGTMHFTLFMSFPL